MKWPWSKKKKATIYKRMTDWEKRPVQLEQYVPMRELYHSDPGELEYQVMRGEKVNPSKDTDALDAAILSYFYKESTSPSQINDFFKGHKALEVLAHYHQWMYREEDAGDLPYLGLSLYLMRYSEEIEAVKFGIILARYYDLMEAKGALETIILLGQWPDFTYYAIQVLKDLPKGSLYIGQMNQATFGYGKMCIAQYLKGKGVLK
ncbi:hypothetical protein HMPREF1633_09530 [Tissierellia bacterium S5-A11]|nr:hypothetical protein HMPREF1633_09530 [Tissierellia bacterium S5-A11]